MVNIGSQRPNHPFNVGSCPSGYSGCGGSLSPSGTIRIIERIFFIEPVLPVVCNGGPNPENLGLMLRSWLEIRNRTDRATSSHVSSLFTRGSALAPGRSTIPRGFRRNARVSQRDSGSLKQLDQSAELRTTNASKIDRALRLADLSTVSDSSLPAALWRRGL